MREIKSVIVRSAKLIYKPSLASYSHNVIGFTNITVIITDRWSHDHHCNGPGVVQRKDRQKKEFHDQSDYR